MRKYLLPIVIVQIQLIIIVFLLHLWYVNSPRILGLSVNIMKNPPKQTASRLRFYYEPGEYEHMERPLPWDSQKIILTETNSDTLNSPQIDDIVSKNNIVAIGDSFTFGQYVDRNDNWVTRLDQKIRDINNLRMVNLGVEGYDIEYAVERYRIRGVKYNPKLIIWYLKNDDFVSIAEKLTALIADEKKKFEKQEMKNASDLVVPKKGEREPVYMTRATDKYMKDFGGIKKIYEYQARKLRSIRDYYKGKIIVMYSDLTGEQQDILKNWKQEDAGIHLFALKELAPDMLYPDSHPNEKGHMFIADSLFEFLNNNQDLLK